MENSFSQNKSVNEDVIDLRAILIKYLKKWYWFVLSVFICAVIAFAYLKTTLPKYSIKTSILLRDDSVSNPLAHLSVLDGLSGGGLSKDVENEIQVLTSKTITSNVVRSLGIETEYYIKKGINSYVELYPGSPIKLLVPESFNDTLTAILQFEIKSAKKGYEIKFIGGKYKEKYILENLSGIINTPYGQMELIEISPVNKDMKYKIITYPNRILTEKYSSAITVAPVNKKSSAILVSTISVTPVKSKIILNKLIDLYNQDVVNDKNLIATNTAYFIKEQISLLEDELSGIEVEVEKYKIDNSLTDISSEAELFLKSIGEYDKKLAEIQTQINLIEYVEEYVGKEENQYGLIPANLGIEDNALILLIKEYNDALLERMKLLRTTNEQNPVISQLENLLSTLRSSIVASIKSINDGLNIAKKDLLEKDSQFTTKIQNIPTQEREYIELKRRQEVTQALYVYLLQKRKENELSMATTLPPAKILDAAYISLGPVSPRKMITFFVAIMLGGIIPLLIIYIMDLMNNKIQDKKEYQKLVHVPYLGSIGINKSTNPVIIQEGKVTPLIEMFRQLRTNLQFMITGKKSPVILVTSSVSGEGKSFISINLAISLTLMKKKVILLGLDVRNPMLGEYLKMPKDNNGITMYLSDSEVKLKDIIFESSVSPNLFIIQGGPVPPNPTELLMSNRLEEMIEELKNSFDYIIIDSAPVGVVSDTFQLNRVVDCTIYVLRQNYTSREMTGLINEIYRDNRLNNMSVVLNGTNDIDTFYGYNHKKYLKES